MYCLEPPYATEAVQVKHRHQPAHAIQDGAKAWCSAGALWLRNIIPGE